MRGVIVLLAVGGLALGGTLVSASGAGVPKHARALASVATGDVKPQGEVFMDKTGERRIDTPVAVPALTVRTGYAIARTDAAAATPVGYATVLARNVDVLDGRVTAYGVRRTARLDAHGLRRTGRVSGLRVDGRFLGDITRPREVAFTGGRVIVNTGSAGLRVVLDDPNADPSDISVAAARVSAVADPAVTPTPTPTATPRATPTPTPTPAAKKALKRRKAPSVRKRLTSSGYAFPVYGRARVADTFGAVRAAPVVKHEGDDVFAPFGSPVVAVRDGTVSRVGTLPISGNRLWLTSKSGDAFFYAHLSAFSNAARDGAQVKAGTVLGFVGNTGDAEPTPPHLHFEVHPGGETEKAVDPYPIVSAWQRRHDVAPGAWLQHNGLDASERPGALVAVRDFIAE